MVSNWRNISFELTHKILSVKYNKVKYALFWASSSLNEREYVREIDRESERLFWVFLFAW